MKITIFGASGSVGREATKQAIEQGHEVTAFVRDPAKLGIEDVGLRIVEGDVMNAASVEQAVSGQDAVLCILGAGRKGKVRSQGTRNIITAMEKAGARRLICQSSLGVGDSSGNLNFFWKYIMFGMLLREAYADHVRQEEFVKQSGLDWTIVRPAAFTDGPRTGKYRHGFSGEALGLTLKISRADVADFLLKQLTDDTYLRKAPGLSY
ncbi:MAG TPA: SDR family oxidoreductase [Pyrinomonadaceae bacterium]|jgi:putative NADH-flavin reductase|nr:SDR family oxidoreductase [Pyrinomonadaceae bacterium]